jgi:mitotic spindle assembly checkpoint protein MAD2B
VQVHSALNMATPPTLLTNYQSILQTFTDFLTVAIHTILYERGLYPASTFISTRKYNFPVRQNRHPKVCQWINDAVSSVSALLLKGAVRRVVVVIYNRDLEVMERFLFDVERFPVVDPKEALTEFEAREGQQMRISVTDVEEQLRATIRKLAYTGSKMGLLPEGCTYTVAVELRDRADPPIGVSSSPFSTKSSTHN